MTRALHSQKSYKPMDIAKLGLIQNSKGEKGTVAGNYSFIIKLINSGRLRAENYSTTGKPYYLVPESEITRYHDTVNKVRGPGRPRKGKL